MEDNLVMNETPEVDIDRLMDEIREEVRLRRDNPIKHSLQRKQEEIVPSHHEISLVDFSEIQSIISSAEAQADVGAQVTPMIRFRRVTRLFALWMGKIILYLSSFITVKQRIFNGTVIQALRKITGGIELLEKQILSQRSQQIETAYAVDTIRGSMDGLKSSIDGLKSSMESLKPIMDGIEKKMIGLEKSIPHLKTGLIMQENRLSILLEEARKRLPVPFDREHLKVLAEEKEHLLEGLYLSFEDQFRGTRKDIKERLKVYLPFLKEADAGTEKMPILDLGCGRGEWLELMQEEKLQARGIDHNRVLVRQCRERGLEASENDMIRYLRSLPDASLGAVTGFHIIEHLPFEVLINLLDETVRVLKPGGIAIFETPNPQNILVGSCNFYADPTHRNPLLSPIMKFLAEARGLCRVRILDLHPFPEAFKVQGSDLADRFNEYFYGPQDYAVVGVKL